MTLAEPVANLRCIKRLTCTRLAAQRVGVTPRCVQVPAAPVQVAALGGWIGPCGTRLRLAHSRCQLVMLPANVLSAMWQLSRCSFAVYQRSSRRPAARRRPPPPPAPPPRPPRCRARPAAAVHRVRCFSAACRRRPSSAMFLRRLEGFLTKIGSERRFFARKPFSWRRNITVGAACNFIEMLPPCKTYRAFSQPTPHQSAWGEPDIHKSSHDLLDGFSVAAFEAAAKS